MASERPVDGIHELLPWYVAGTLAEVEAVAFRDHLPSCPDCRAELEVVEKMRLELVEHGAAFLEEHPAAELLVAAARGELEDEEQAVRVRRHLTLCAACATETRWVAGEAVAGREEPEAAIPGRPAARGRWVALAAAATVLLGLVTIFALRRDATGPALRIARPVYVRPPERAEGAANVVRFAPGERRIDLIFPVDVVAQAFPLRLELESADGKVVHLEEGIAREDLLEGVYLFVECDRRLCAPGSYLVKIGKAGAVEPELVFRLTVEGGQVN